MTSPCCKSSRQMTHSPLSSVNMSSGIKIKAQSLLEKLKEMLQMSKNKSHTLHTSIFPQPHDTKHSSFLTYGKQVTQIIYCDKHG